MTQAISGMGTELQRNGTPIAEVYDIGGPEFSADTIEATHLKSPGWWREFIGSLKDGGEITFSVNLILSDPSHNAATGLLSALAGSEAPPVDSWAIVFPDDDETTFTLPGILTKYKTGATIDDKLAAEITVKVSGAPTLV
jgi:predicted secreted protein